MRGKRLSTGLRAILAIFTMALFGASTWAATHEEVLHNFNGTDGSYPPAGLIFDAAGNLYGTTSVGAYGFGTVFELSPTEDGGWTEQLLHSFNNNGTDGQYPFAGLIFDKAGNLYGTTFGGGTYDLGTVFELSPTGDGGWTEKVLHSFNNNGTDGVGSGTGLIIDAAGNLYGTTSGGGTYNIGTVFELSPTADGGWMEKVLHNFNYNGTDGYFPSASLIFDKAGNLYSTTSYGGTYGYGTVFELSPKKGGDWTEKVLYSFNKNGTDGYGPGAGLIFDKAGNLYSTTGGGGTYDLGTAFELSPTGNGGWTEKVLHSFNDNGTDGYSLMAGLIFDKASNLYGTTNRGGTYNEGTVFKLTPIPPCAVCRLGGVDVPPAERRDAPERGGIERP